MPKVWSRKQIRVDAVRSIQEFRENRIREPQQLYLDLFVDNLERVRHVMSSTEYLLGLEDQISQLLGDGYYDVIRYLSAPPISADDLHTIAELDTKESASRLSSPENSRKVFEFITRVLDVKRFGWVREGRVPNDAEQQAALVSTAALLSTQQVQTHRRSLAKGAQESAVKEYLSDVLRYREVPTRAIDTAFDAPRAYEFCGESSVAGKKADIVVGLGDNRFMCIECKVSNSEVNSFKRLNHETIEKTVHWYRSFGTNGVVCAGLLSGVFKVDNLMAAQDAGVSIFWSHNLESLGAFIESTHETDVEFGSRGRA